MSNQANDSIGLMLEATLAGFTNKENRIVEQTKVNGFFVSTVRLTIDHGFDGHPLWYETMIFDRRDGGDSFSDIYCDRYETREEAVIGHAKAVSHAEAGCPESE